MTESEWLECTDPEKMLEFLRGKASDRKLQLFAVASFKRLVALLPDPRQRHGIEVLEQFAERIVAKVVYRSVTAEVRQAIPRNDYVAGMPPTNDPYYIALMLYREFCSSSIAVHAVQATAGLVDRAGEQREQIRLMRDIVGPMPFRPVHTNTSWLRWNDGIVVKLAQTIYDERAFDRMPILADALEEAGCTDTDILDHCHQPGEHVRGCWVVDLLLGKS